MRPARSRRLLLVATLVASAPALGQQDPPAEADLHELNLIEEKAKDPSLFNFSYSSPETIPFALIGRSSNDIPRAADPKAFAASILGGALGDNSTSQGLAIEFSPFWGLGSRNLSLESYRGGANRPGPGFLDAALMRSTVGIAFTSGTGMAQPSADKAEAETEATESATDTGSTNSSPSGIVLGISTKLLRTSDPLLDSDYDVCVKAAFDAAREDMEAAGSASAAPVLKLEERQLRALGVDTSKPLAGEFTRLGITPAQLQALNKSGKLVSSADVEAARLQGKRAWLGSIRASSLNAALATCDDEMSGRLASAASLDVGFGQRWTGDPGRLHNLRGSGTILWATYSSGVLNRKSEFFRARLIFHGRYVIGETAYDDLFIRQGRSDSVTVALGIESAPEEPSLERFRWSIQTGYTDKGAAGPDTQDQRYWRTLGTAAVKVTDEFWLTGTYGKVAGKGIENDDYFLFGVTFSPPAKKKGLDAALAASAGAR